jgi:DNA-directed RNA polymerase specialized sigma24 family protein
MMDATPSTPSKLGELPMSHEGSITLLLTRLKQGDGDAAGGLWRAYSQRLVALARARLGGAIGLADEEDVVLSAFDSFYRGVARGRFPALQDRDDLWQLLFVITMRKSINLVKHEGRRSRGGGRLVSLGRLEEEQLDRVLGADPSPELAAQMTEECRQLLDRLGDSTLRSVALWKMEGETNREIAVRLGCVVQTVERKLRSIRALWSSEDPT